MIARLSISPLLLPSMEQAEKAAFSSGGTAITEGRMIWEKWLWGAVAFLHQLITGQEMYMLQSAVTADLGASIAYQYQLPVTIP